MNAFLFLLCFRYHLFHIDSVNGVYYFVFVNLFAESRLHLLVWVGRMVCYSAKIHCNDMNKIWYNERKEWNKRTKNLCRQEENELAPLCQSWAKLKLRKRTYKPETQMDSSKTTSCKIFMKSESKAKAKRFWLERSRENSWTKERSLIWKWAGMELRAKSKTKIHSIYT